MHHFCTPNHVNHHHHHALKQPCNKKTPTNARTKTNPNNKKTKKNANNKGSMMRDGWSSSYQAPPAKRNIGALARMGLLRSDPNSYGQLRAHGGRQQQPQRMAAKRHLGSLARSGWLQAFRPTRAHRFIRSGRDESDIVGSCDLLDVCCSVFSVHDPNS